MKGSPQFKKDRFENTPPQDPDMRLWESLKLYLQGQKREPTFEIPVTRLTAEALGATPAPGLRAYWFGHAPFQATEWWAAQGR